MINQVEIKASLTIFIKKIDKYFVHSYTISEVHYKPRFLNKKL